MPWRRQKICCHYFFHFCILRPFLLINHLHLWRGKDNPSRTASCLYHQFKCGTNSSVSCRALEGLCSKSWPQFKVLRKTLVFKVVTTGFHWMSSLAAKKAAVRCDRGVKYFAVYNPQLCLTVNVKPPHSRVIPKIFVLRIAFSPLMEKRPTYSCLGGISTELVQELTRGLDDLCPESCLQFLVPYFQSDLEVIYLESCPYWVQKKSPK